LNFRDIYGGREVFSDVLRDIVGNIQDIIRSEFHLPKTELQEEIPKGQSSLRLLAAGTVNGMFACFFLLEMIVYALVLVLPGWTAA
jgi:hypothetical protein